MFCKEQMGGHFMKDFSWKIRICRTLYYATGLPVRLTAGGKDVFSMPEKIVTAADVIGDASLMQDALAEDSGASADVHYSATPAGERFAVIRPEAGTFVSVGPFLVEQPSDAFIAGLVRSGALKLHSREAMREYLNSLPVLSARQYYYTGKLIEMLFNTEGLKRASTPATGMADEGDDYVSEAGIPDSYFIRSQEYKSELFLHSPYMVEQEICHFISLGDTDGALHVLSEINSSPRAQLAKNTLRSLKNSMICSCAFMARAAIAGGLSADEAFTLSDAYIQEIESAGGAARVLAYETEMVRGYTAAVKSAAGRDWSKTVHQAADYINSHLCEDLSVEKIADAVFLNPNYLSGIFARETGETVHSFIIRRRIEEAGFFVRNTDESFADIASFYRFCSQSHFTRCFREIMGTTPGKYRNGYN